MEQPELGDLGPNPAGALALIGAWEDIPDEVIDEFIEHIYRTRAEDLGRNVQLDP